MKAWGCVGSAVLAAVWSVEAPASGIACAPPAKAVRAMAVLAMAVRTILRMVTLVGWQAYG
jgi:hypothetical protein